MPAHGYREFLEELFEPLGGVTIRRMFGGLGIHRDGMMVALSADDVLYLKADRETIPLFEAEGSSPFSYDTKTGRHTTTSYWRAPERLYDEPDEFLSWARSACAAALRAQAAKSAGKRKKG